jgi:hypothetical protein
MANEAESREKHTSQLHIIFDEQKFRVRKSPRFENLSLSSAIPYAETLHGT